MFYRKRPFTRDEFKAFIFSQSQELPESRAILARMAKSRKYFLGTINNEPLELNLRRIEQFNLRQEFEAFFSSCFVGLRKPEEGIYRLEECLFIDDRALNLECAQQMGMRTIHFQDAAQLCRELIANGVSLAER